MKKISLLFCLLAQCLIGPLTADLLYQPKIDEFPEEEEDWEEENLADTSLDDFDTLEEIISEQEPSQLNKMTAGIRKTEKIQVEEPASLPVEIDQILSQDEKLITASPISPVDTLKEKTSLATSKIEINLKEVFKASPIIYSILLMFSIFSVCLWFYSMMTVRAMEFLPPGMIKDLRAKLISHQFNEALDICVKEKHFFCKMLASGILVRKHGFSMMVDTMKAEGKRCTIAFWQRIGLLNDIAIIAPMIGLLGTVLGMFYAFYDLNRSLESISLLFDGLGISVGTTVAGLFVAILSMILHSSAKYRLVRVLTGVENEAQTFAALVDTRAPNYLEQNL